MFEERTTSDYSDTNMEVVEEEEEESAINMEAGKEEESQVMTFCLCGWSWWPDITSGIYIR